MQYGFFYLSNRHTFVLTLMSTRNKIRISFLVGVFSWILFSFFDLYFILLKKYEMKEAYAEIVPQIFLTIFIASTLFYYRYIITKAESVNFMDLLWRVFITGLVTTIISLGIRLFFNLYQGSSFIENPITINFFYHIYVGLVVIYLISTFVVWKRLILYQKSKNLIQLWNFFETALVLALLFDFLGFELESNRFNIALVFLTTFSLVLSLNLKWIAYLNFKQKWKSILFILLSGIYLYHFYINLTIFSSTDALIYDLLDRIFIVSILLFILIYAAIAILVTLFNLPTSSVFERKLKEAVDFQKLSQSVPAGQSELETYEILLDSSMSAVFADAAWLEFQTADGNEKLVSRFINAEEVRELKDQIKNEQIRSVVDLEYSGNISQSRVYTSLSRGDFRSIFALPILIKNKQVGALVLLKEVSDAFNKEMVNIITTFVNQASITLENARLLDDAIENERYKEQLSIAKNVQKSLLPSELATDGTFCISAYSMAADEVGGDYYDIVNHGDGEFGLIISDVSGKGTSAAFNMAQMKGIFHSLSQVSSDPGDFIRKANDALGRCLEKSSFITASYYLINTEQRKVDYVRAGHCPTLRYNAAEGTVEIMQTDGMGLGIIRNSTYDKYVHTYTFNYKPGDVVLLHTDGITEAMDPEKNQFGTIGLKDSLQRHAKKEPEKIKEGIIEDLYQYLNGTKLEDDYTLVIMKFV